MAAAALAGGAGPAVAEAASPFEQFRWEGSGTEIVNGHCGDLVVRIEFREHGHVVARAPGTDRVPRYTVTWQGESAWTNLATGRAFTFKWSVAQQEVSAVDNGDGTLTVLWQSAGNEHIYGPDGQRLRLLAGLGRSRLLFDNAGTPTDPSDDAFISSEFVSLNGRPEPGGPLCTEFRALTA